MNAKRWTILILLIIFTGLVLYKTVILNYTPATILPVSGYEVNVSMQMDGHGSAIRTVVALPSSNYRQTIFSEQADAASFHFTINRMGGNRFGIWENTALSGHHTFRYTFNVKAKRVRFSLPDSLPIPFSYGNELRQYLKSTDRIQVGSIEIIDALADLGLNQDSDAIEAVRKVYHFTADRIQTTGFSGTTDALTTLRLGEASCNGKSRLFVAMMRTLGIPARLVGGLILKHGSKRTSHQWVEIYLGNNWVHFDPTNKHFADLPENYLVVYYNDQFLFQRTANVNFKYSFIIEHQFFPRESDYTDLAAHPLNIMNAWSLFQRAGLSFGLLRIILMIPIGALVTIIFRNVIGVRTFGTFLPALIASAFRESGLMWGLVSFVSIILLGALLRVLLDRLRLLHTPKLTILLVFVVFSLLTISALGVRFDNMNIAKSILFPLAVMAITIERFSLVAQESDIWLALKLFGNTIITVIFCYTVINSLFLQTVVLAFPEVMLLVICSSIYLGNWTGIRISELIRFRSLIFHKEEASS